MCAHKHKALTTPMSDIALPVYSKNIWRQKKNAVREVIVCQEQDFFHFIANMVIHILGKVNPANGICLDAGHKRNGLIAAYPGHTMTGL